MNSSTSSVLEVAHLHLGPEPDAIGGRLVVFQLGDLLHALVQLTQARLHELLPLERGLVLRVPPEVAHLDCLGDGLGKQDVEFMAELVDFAAQLLPHLLDHSETRKGRSAWLVVKDTPEIPPARKIRAAEVHDL